MPILLEQALEDSPKALVIFHDEEVHGPPIRLGAVDATATRDWFYSPILRIA
jgi:hypothetical protein